MVSITVVNETKNMKVKFLSDFAYREKYEAKYGVWATEDQITRMKIAEENNEYLLVGQSGFGKQPAWSDIRNKKLNTHGDLRVSGFSGPLELTLYLEPYVFCNKYNNIYLYDYLIATFTNEFDSITIYFDLGCEVVYQYYSFQTEDESLGTFDFLGANGGNFYYVDGGRNYNATLVAQRSFIPSAMVTTDDFDTKNDDNFVHLQQNEITVNCLVKIPTTYSVEIFPVNESIFPFSFFETLYLSFFGNTYKIEGKYKQIKIENGTVTGLDYIGNIWINLPSLGLPQELEEGDNSFSFSTDYQRGDFTCRVHLEKVGRY